MPKKFKSWKRAERRGHLTLHVFRDRKNVVHSQLVYTKKRFGEGNPLMVYMHLNSIQGDPQRTSEK